MPRSMWKEEKKKKKKKKSDLWVTLLDFEETVEYESYKYLKKEKYNINEVDKEIGSLGNVLKLTEVLEDGTHTTTINYTVR